MIAGIYILSAVHLAWSAVMWHDNLIFSEYFHGDNGAAISAFHQTWWIGLIAGVILRRHGASNRRRRRARTDRKGAVMTNTQATVLPGQAPRPAPCRGDLRFRRGCRVRVVATRRCLAGHGGRRMPGCGLWCSRAS